MKKIKIVTLALLLGYTGFAQESQQSEVSLTLPKVSYIDSLKATFVNHSTSNCIDPVSYTHLTLPTSDLV